MRIFLHHLPGRLAAAAVLAACVWAAPLPVRAELAVAGPSTAIRLEANDASLEEIFLALQASFNLRYRTLATLDGPVSGSFRGPLARVAAQLLERYDFIMKVSAQNVDISVLRRHAQSEPPGPASPSPQRPRVLPVPPAMSAREAFMSERR
jgi:hypothetical protein